nr:MAG TPA: hypothetical protein [Caudoviricetes sp.]
MKIIKFDDRKAFIYRMLSHDFHIFQATRGNAINYF